MTKERKEEIIKTFATHEGDTGSPEVQIALLKESTTLTMTTLTFTRKTTTQEEVFL